MYLNLGFAAKLKDRHILCRPFYCSCNVFLALLTTSNNVGDDTILPLELHASIFGRLIASPTMLIECGRIWNPPLRFYLLTFTAIDTIRNYTTKQKSTPRFWSAFLVVLNIIWQYVVCFFANKIYFFRTRGVFLHTTSLVWNIDLQYSLQWFNITNIVGGPSRYIQQTNLLQRLTTSSNVGASCARPLKNKHTKYQSKNAPQIKLKCIL